MPKVEDDSQVYNTEDKRMDDLVNEHLYIKYMSQNKLQIPTNKLLRTRSQKSPEFRALKDQELPIHLENAKNAILVSSKLENHLKNRKNSKKYQVRTKASRMRKFAAYEFVDNLDANATGVTSNGYGSF